MGEGRGERICWGWERGMNIQYGSGGGGRAVLRKNEKFGQNLVESLCCRKRGLNIDESM